MTPPEVREQRKAEVALQLAELEKQVNTATNYLTEQCNFGQCWRKMSRSSGGTRRKRG
jgi:hypothetical protein